MPNPSYKKKSSSSSHKKRSSVKKSSSKSKPRKSSTSYKKNSSNFLGSIAKTVASSVKLANKIAPIVSGFGDYVPSSFKVNKNRFVSLIEDFVFFSSNFLYNFFKKTKKIVIHLLNDKIQIEFLFCF